MPPPAWERRLGRLLPREQRDAALGDAAEEWAARARRDGEDAARRWYVRQVVRSVGSALVRALAPTSPTRRPRGHRPGGLIMWIRDLALALRMLRREPLFSTIALVTLAIGIGATTALFSVYRAVFLNPIPLPDPERLVFVMEQSTFGCCGPASGPDYAEWVVRQRAFAGLGILKPGSVTLTGTGEAERVYGTAVSAGVFQLLGVPPLLGRTLNGDDEAHPAVVVLNYGLWQRRFGGRSGVLGTTLEIDGAPYAIVGVMPRAFDVPSPWLGTRRHDLYTPFARTWLSDSRGNRSYPVVARLTPGETLASAQADMSRVMRELGHDYPETNADRGVKLFTAHDYMFGTVGRELALILGAAALALLIACANIAGLQLARTTARATELAVRAALGATRPALVRLLLAEGLVLATAGGLAGLGLAALMIDGLRALLPTSIPRVDQVHIDGAVVAFVIGTATATALVFGVVPSVAASSGRLVRGLGTRGDLTPGRQRLRDAFIVVQIALGLMLANGASLLVRSYTLLRSQAPGFQAEGVLTLSVQPSGDRYKTPDQIRAYYRDLVTRTAAVPGVESVGTISRLPLSGGMNGHVLVEGRAARASQDRGPLVEVTSVTGNYLPAMGIRLLRGRALTADDDAPGRLNAVINRHFAREAWPTTEALGKRFSFTDNPPQWVTVVGVVDDIRQWGPEDPAVSQAYFTVSNGWTTAGYLVVRAAGDPASLGPSIRQAILAVDRTQPPADVETMSSRVNRAYAQRRFYTFLIGLFAAAAVLLAAGGVYGTVAYYVARRRRELGLRAALGASVGGLVGLVVGRGARLAALGLALGLAGVWGVSSVLSTVLYGIAPLDGWTMAGSAAVFATVAVAASALPARRAARVSPVMALRAD